MNKLQVIAVLVALLALSAQSFRVVREAGDEPEAEAEAEPLESEPIMAEAAPVAEVMEEVPVASEPVEEHVAEAVEEHVAEAVEEAVIPDGPAGPVTRITDGVKQYYASGVDTANSYIESIQGMKLEEKAKNLYDDTVKAANTYYGIIYDQLYHVVYPQQ